MQNRQFGALGAPVLGILCFVLVIVITVVVFYLLTLQKALSRVRPRNRLMEPGLVWLIFIPIFNYVWAFFIATRIPDSLRNEFRDQGRDDGTDYGKGIGLALAIIQVVALPFNAISNVAPNFGLIVLPVGLAALVLFILFWVKIAGYSAQLAVPGRFRDDRFDEDDRDRDDRDDYDDYPRGPPRPSSDAFRPEDEGHYH